MTLNLEVNEVNVILEALGEQPAKKVMNVIPKIINQAQAQAKQQNSDAPPPRPVVEAQRREDTTP